MTLVRLPNWEDRLHAYLDACASRPFAYGTFDCALFAAGAVEAMTGQDFGAPFRGRYRSAAGAVRALRLYGAGDLPATFSAALGTPVAALRAHRGDILLRKGAAGVATARGGVFAGESGDGLVIGLIEMPRGSCECAWVVPYE